MHLAQVRSRVDSNKRMPAMRHAKCRPSCARYRGDIFRICSRERERDKASLASLGALSAHFVLLRVFLRSRHDSLLVIVVNYRICGRPLPPPLPRRGRGGIRVPKRNSKFKRGEQQVNPRVLFLFVAFSSSRFLAKLSIHDFPRGAASIIDRSLFFSAAPEYNSHEYASRRVSFSRTVIRTDTHKVDEEELHHVVDEASDRAGSPRVNLVHQGSDPPRFRKRETREKESRVNSSLFDSLAANRIALFALPTKNPRDGSGRSKLPSNLPLIEPGIDHLACVATLIN